MEAKPLLIPFVLGLGLALVLLWSLEGQCAPVVAAPISKRVLGAVEGSIVAPSTPAAELHVCSSGCDYSSVQNAVDAANDGDVIKVAIGVYTDIHARAGVTQVVYISKTVTIQGGFTTADWSTSNPISHPTTLDAQGQGRVFYIVGNVTPTIEGLRITGGDATGLGGSPWGWGYYDTGGGVYAVSATVMLTDSLVFSNTAYHGGGAGVVNATITVMNSQVFSNTAEGSGGGIYVINAVEDDGYGTNVISITVAIVGNRVFGNNAKQGGGGVYVTNEVDPYADYFGNVTVIVSDSLVFGNTAEPGSGGGLYLSNSTAVLTGNTFTANTASYDGGGLMLIRCLFCPFAGLPPRLDGNTFIANCAGYNGGGLYLGYHSTMLSNNVVASNTADYGGGLFVHFGGGMFTNTVVTDNRADSAGGGLHFVGSWSRLLHTTIVRNRGGDGSGICLSWYKTGSILIPNRIALTNTIAHV